MITFSFGVYAIYAMISIAFITGQKPTTPRQVSIWRGLMYLQTPLMILAADPMMHGDKATQVMWCVIIIYAVADTFMKTDLEKYEDMVGWCLATNVIVITTVMGVLQILGKV